MSGELVARRLDRGYILEFEDGKEVAVGDWRNLAMEAFDHCIDPLGVKRGDIIIINIEHKINKEMREIEKGGK